MNKLFAVKVWDSDHEIWLVDRVFLSEADAQKWVDTHRAKLAVQEFEAGQNLSGLMPF